MLLHKQGRQADKHRDDRRRRPQSLVSAPRRAAEACEMYRRRLIAVQTRQDVIRLVVCIDQPAQGEQQPVPRRVRPEVDPCRVQCENRNAYERSCEQRRHLPHEHFPVLEAHEQHHAGNVKVPQDVRNNKRRYERNNIVNRRMNKVMPQSQKLQRKICGAHNGKQSKPEQLFVSF